MAMAPTAPALALNTQWTQAVLVAYLRNTFVTLSTTPETIEQLGAFVDFAEPFEVLEDTGMIVFGHVRIETNTDYDWDQEESEQ
jgi:hypothetical protein